MKQIIGKTKYVLRYSLYIFLFVAVVDIFLFKKVLNLGYTTNYSQTNLERFPHPYYEFAGKPNELNHNSLGFKGEIFSESDLKDSSLIKIAFFGGSTGYMGKPPIADLLQSLIGSQTGKRTKVMNYSAISSNHRQHIHCMIEYLSKYQPDIVIFYGGYNETCQPATYDPRPGYPYNYFFRAELSTFKKLLIENSAIAGTIDKANNGVITGLKNLRDSNHVLSDEWKAKIFENYFETLSIGDKLSGALCSNKFKTKFYAFYQPYRVPEECKSNHLRIKDSGKSNRFFYDVSDVIDHVKDSAYTDIVHVRQFANEIIAKKIAATLYSGLQRDMNP